jgi:hypothetical protein
VHDDRPDTKIVSVRRLTLLSLRSPTSMVPDWESKSSEALTLDARGAVHAFACWLLHSLLLRIRGDKLRGSLVDGATDWLQLSTGGYMLTFCSGQSGSQSGGGYGQLVRQVHT